MTLARKKPPTNSARKNIRLDTSRKATLTKGTKTNFQMTSGRKNVQKKSGRKRIARKKLPKRRSRSFNV
jgi:hypothetical protein